MGFRSPVECAGCGEAELILGIDEMHDRIMTERAEAEAKAARLFYGNQGEPIFLIDHADELARMRARAYGLALAIDGLELTEGPTRDGIIRLAQDLADGLQRLQTLFDVERGLWRAAEKVEAQQ